MFNDKLLEYRENGDLERLSRQVALQFPNSASLFGLQNIFLTLLKRFVGIPNSALLYGHSPISCL
jgi:hypothetical protein